MLRQAQLYQLVISLCFWAVVFGQQCPARTVVTYNAGLLDTTMISKNRIERRDAITGALRGMDADVVCLQEVWIGQDVDFMVRMLKDVYPFAWSQLHMKSLLQPMDVRRPACDVSAMKMFYKCCKKQKCIKLRKRLGDLTKCVGGQCLHIFERLPQQCITCMAASMSKPRSLYRKCGGNGYARVGMRAMNEPGLLILSKLPMRNRQYRDFHPFTRECIQRGFLSVDIATIGKVVCTHTTHNSKSYLEPELWGKGFFKSYVEQGFAERSQLIATFRHVSPLILMGDFNVAERFSPAVLPDLPDQFLRLALYFDVVPLKKCTLCWRGENPYNANVQAVKNTVVDHIFYKGLNVVDVLRVR